MSCTEDISEDDVTWKQKFEKAEKNLVTLKHLARSALSDYEDLQTRYRTLHNKNEELKKSLLDAESKLYGLQQVLEPAIDEYTELQTKFDIERTCRAEAELHAAKFYKENVKLKRQSEMLLDKLGSEEVFKSQKVNIKDFLEALTTDKDGVGFDSVDAATDNPRDALNMKITALESELALLEQKLLEAESERLVTNERSNQLTVKCCHLENELKQSKQAIDQRDEALQNLKNVTALACTEYEELQKKYEREWALNQEAVRYANKMQSERDTAIRESSVIGVSVVSDDRLRTALKEIDTLNMQLLTLNTQHDERVRELEATIKMSGEAKTVGDLENKLWIANKELDRIQRLYDEAEKMKLKLEKENVSLVNAMDVIQQRLHPAPPPVPPPPPPPPPPPAFLRPFQILMRRKHKDTEDLHPQLNKLGKPKDKVYEEALAEMMQRIKQGGGLKPVQAKTLTAERPPTGMNELQRVLRGMKKGAMPNDQVDGQTENPEI